MTIVSFLTASKRSFPPFVLLSIFAFASQILFFCFDELSKENANGKNVFPSDQPSVNSLKPFLYVTRGRFVCLSDVVSQKNRHLDSYLSLIYYLKNIKEIIIKCRIHTLKLLKIITNKYIALKFYFNIFNNINNASD
jgi:hypothetical protein